MLLNIENAINILLNEYENKKKFLRSKTIVNHCVYAVYESNNRSV